MGIKRYRESHVAVIYAFMHEIFHVFIKVTEFGFSSKIVQRIRRRIFDRYQKAPNVRSYTGFSVHSLMECKNH